MCNMAAQCPSWDVSFLCCVEGYVYLWVMILRGNKNNDLDVGFTVITVMEEGVGAL
jgi:hypothetical protein